MDQSTLIFLRIIGSFVFSFFLSLFLVRKIISYFKVKRVGQSERDYLENHKAKDGTPTMGGISIVISTIFTFILFSFKESLDIKIVGLLIAYLGFFIVGFIDDFCKVKFASYKGMSAKSRLLLEILISIWAIFFIVKGNSLEQSFYFSFSKNIFSLGLLTLPFLIFIIVGSANSFNLTDGLDGLAAGLEIIALTPFILLALIKGQLNLALFLMAQVGATLGFLVYNFHPASIFMGDVGSLPLGALLGICTYILNEPLVLLIAGFLFVLETLSVIIQVIYFKLTKKRIFLMAPLHHHFEKKGWPEWKVVMVFYIFEIILSILAIVLGVLL